MDIFPPRRTLWTVIAAFFGLGFAVYWASLGNNFVAWDDTYLIYFNAALKEISFDSLKTIFTTYDPELYIPFTLFTYQLDYLIGGLNPFIYHFHNLILHTLSALTVTWIVARLAGRNIAGLVAGLLFLLHPLNVEAVAWASGRKDVLSTLFFLLSIALWMRWREVGGKRIYSLSIIAFALSLMAKVMTVTLPVVLLLIDLLRARRMDKSAWLEKLPYAALSVLFGIIGVLGKQTVSAESTLLEKALMAGKSTLFYLEKLVFPMHLSVMYPYNDPITISSPDFYLPLIFLVLLLGVVFWTLRHTRIIAFGVAFFLITLAPTFLNLIKGGEVYFASDRYVYIPAIGLFLLVGLGCALLWERARAQAKTALAGGGAVILLLLCLLTYKQSLTWKNSETLFLNTISYYPEALSAHLNLGRVYRESERIDDAVNQLNEALRIRPHPRIYSNLAAIRSRQGDKEEAMRMYRKGMEVDPKDPEPVFGVAIVLAEQKKYAEAEAMYLRAIQLNANFTGIYNNLGAMYLEMGRLADAETQFNKAIEVDPYFADPHYNLAKLLADRGESEAAMEHLEKTLKIDPGSLDAAILLAPLYVQAGSLDDAVKLAEKFLDAKPGNPTAEKLAFDTVKSVLKANPQNTRADRLLNRMMDEGILQKKSR